MEYLLMIAAGYLLGSSNMALYISKAKHVDLRGGGSGNLGTSNVIALIGWAEGILVAVHDVGKSALAVVLAQYFFPQLPYLGALAGIAGVLGHTFPFYLKFRGGKGLAAYVGVTLALDWRLAVAVVALFLLTSVITDYVVLGTALVVLVVPVYLGLVEQDLLLALIMCVGTAVILFLHRENYVRVYKGTEIGLRSGAKGEYRTK